MSDDAFGAGGRRRKGTSEDIASVSRYPSVTGSLDTVFDLLGDSRRRYLLYYLFALEGEVVEFETAVNAVYKYEAAVAETDRDSSRESVRISLHHDHLPRLQDAGTLEYDRRQGTIRFAGHSALEEWVEHAQAEELK